MEIIHEGLPLEEFPDYQDNAVDNNNGDIHDEKKLRHTRDGMAAEHLI